MEEIKPELELENIIYKDSSLGSVSEREREREKFDI